MPEIPPPFPGAAPCPQCAYKGIVSYLRMNYAPECLQCARHPACGFQILFQYYGHEMLVEETALLLESGYTYLIEDFLSKEGKPFSAHLVLGKTTRWRVRPLFDNELFECKLLQLYQGRPW